MPGDPASRAHRPYRPGWLASDNAVLPFLLLRYRRCARSLRVLPTATPEPAALLEELLAELVVRRRRDNGDARRDCEQEMPIGHQGCA
jgi:hypothetical protein